MKCVLLCAGFATRLSPLTDDLPKPLLDVGGRPLLDDLMDRLVGEAGLHEFVLVANGRFAGHFARWWADARPQWPDTRLELIDDGARSNATRLGAVRDLQLAIERCRLRGPLFVAAADNLVRFDVGAFVADFRTRPRNLILSYEEPDVRARQRSGVAEVDASGRVLRFVEKSETPPGRLVSPPFYIFCDDALAEIPRLIEAQPDVDAPGGLVAWLAPRVVVEHHPMRGRRHDIGNLESYAAARAIVEAERGGGS